MMFERRIILCTAPLLLSLVPAVTAAEQVTVPTVTKVTFNFKQGAIMEVTGEVPNGGYKDPELIKVTYIKQPDDGIQDFNFVATKPEGIVTQAFTKISERYDWKGEIPAWVKGVRIHGMGQGIKTVMIER